MTTRTEGRPGHATRPTSARRGARVLRSVLRPGGTAVALLAASAFLAAAGRGAAPVACAEEGDETVYAFDVVLAPVCLEGTFPLTVNATGGDLDGSVTLDTDLWGKLTGTLDLDGVTYAVTGNVTHAKGKSVLALSGKSGALRISVNAQLTGTEFVGTAKGKGGAVTAKTPCRIDVSGASPQVATIELDVAEGKNAKVTGTGRVTACGETHTLKVSGKTTKLAASAGKAFRFAAKQEEGGTFLWSADGFGADSSSTGLALDELAPPSGLAYAFPMAEYETEDPIAPNAPSAGTNERGTFAIVPALPAGLSFDPATGRISGTPTEIRGSTTYTVTATNFAGSTTAQIQFATRINRSKSFDAELRPLTTEQKLHFLQRTRFGVTAADRALLDSQGVSGFLNTMLVFQQNTAVEQAAFAELQNTGDPVGLEGKFPSSSQLSRWYANLMMNNDNPFQEIIGFFWHDHFGVSSNVLFDNSSGFFMTDHVNLLRRQGNGNLRELLKDISRDPAMLVFLDGYVNTRTAPNENFAREFWELYTLGVDNGYTQADIVQASKAWSGWRQRYDAVTGLPYMQFDATRHNVEAKSFFGQTIPANTTTDDFDAVVDITLDHKPVAEFITKKFFEYFCYENPPEELVTTMADFLRQQDYELTPFFRALFQSEAFFSPKSRLSQVKNPVEFGIGFIRSTGLKIRTSTLDGHLNNLAQRPTQPPTVNGWPLGELWLGSQGMADRVNLVFGVVGDTTNQTNAGINVANILPADRTPGPIVDHLAELLRVPLSAEDRQTLIDYMNTTRQSNGTIVASPFNGSQAHIDERVRGLLLILAQNPAYQVR